VDFYKKTNILNSYIYYIAKFFLVLRDKSIDATSYL